MAESEDPTGGYLPYLLIAGGGIAGGMALASMTADSTDMPSVKADRTQRAEPLSPIQRTEAADRRKKLLAGSMLTKDWDLSLSKPALLGIN